MKNKITDEQMELTLNLITIALDNYSKDDEVFSFECPICKKQAISVLAMFEGSLHGSIECKGCDTYIHI